MKKVFIVICVFFFLTVAAYGAEQKVRKVTGPVLELTKDTIAIQRGKGKSIIYRDASTKVKGDLKVGQKVTIEYVMVAKSIETKEAKAKKNKTKK